MINNQSNGNHNNRRIIKNTLLLYIRMGISMSLGFFATRILLQALGEEDFGLVNVLGSIVAMFSVITSPLSVAASRFTASVLGKQDYQHLSETFSLLSLIYLTLVVCILIFGIPLAILLFHTKIKIPPESVNAAFFFLMLSILTLCISLLKVPLIALVIAHEDMNFFAWQGIIDCLLRLGAFCLLFVFQNRLIAYGAALCSIELFDLTAYLIFTRFRYPRCKFFLHWNGRQAREIMVFSGLQMGGGLAGIFNNSFTNILLNNVFGVSVNAARGLAMQVSTGVGSFSQNFLTAINPQIIKSYSAQNYNVATILVMRASRLSFFLIFMIAFPCILQAEFLCSIWLKETPEYTVAFIRLVLIQIIIDSFSYPLMTLVSASGTIALYQAVVGGTVIMTLPVSYILLRCGYPPTSVFMAAIGCSILCLPIRLWLVRRVTKLPINKFIFDVMKPTLRCLALAVPVPLTFACLWPVSNNFIACIWQGAFTVLISGGAIFFFGITRQEQAYALEIFHKAIGIIGIRSRA